MEDRKRGREMSVFWPSPIVPNLLTLSSTDILSTFDQACFLQSVTPILGIPLKKGPTTFLNDDDKMTWKARPVKLLHY